MEARIVGGRYELIEIAGQDALSTIWRGRVRGELDFRPAVAIGRVREAFVEDDELLRRILEDLAAATDLGHPGIVRTLDVVRDGEQLYLVSEWMDGMDIGAWTVAHATRGEAVPWAIATAATIEALRALAAAHERIDDDGRPAPLVHGDLSAQSILLTRAGVVRLRGFGIGRVLAPPGGPIRPERVAVAAPEPTRDGAPSVATDVYGAGALLFTALAGRAPFVAATAFELTTLVREAEPPDLGMIRRDVPEAVIAAVERALRKEPGERFDGARAMARALAACLRSTAAETDARAVAASLDRAFAAMEEEEAEEVPRGVPPQVTAELDVSDLERLRVKTPSGIPVQRTEHLDLADVERLRIPEGLAPQRTEHLDLAEVERLTVPEPRGLVPQLTEPLDLAEVERLEIKDPPGLAFAPTAQIDVKEVERRFKDEPSELVAIPLTKKKPAT